MVEVITKSEAGRRWGVSHTMVGKYVARGLPVRDDGKLDWAEVDAWHATNVVSERSGSFRARTSEVPEPVPFARSAEPEQLALVASSEESLSEAARQNEWLKLRERQLRVGQIEGRLVELGPVNAFVAGMIITARDELMRIPAELRDTLAHETDPLRCEEVLSSKIRESLEKLSQYRLPVAA